MGIKLWSYLIIQLVQADDESCDICCRIISRIKKIKSNIEINFIPIAMQEVAIEILIDLYYQIYPFETIQFLIEQFQTFSECDISANDNDVCYFLI